MVSKLATVGLQGDAWGTARARTVLEGNDMKRGKACSATVRILGEPRQVEAEVEEEEGE